MWKKSKITDPTATGQGPEQEKPYKKRVGIKKTSKVPGVMVTQYVEELPEGVIIPDFLRKPIALTIQEGKLAIFKARVCGVPKPELTWKRHNGDLSDTEKYQKKFDEATGEYTLEIPKVSGDQTDTYKCYAVNEYGKAVVTAALNVIEVGFKKKKAMEELDVETTDPTEFRKLLRKRARLGKQEEKKDPGEIDDKFWEIIMSADRKDYERICTEFGVKDFRVMLKKLSERKKEREEEQSKYIEYISNLKHIEVKGEGCMASFELEMELKDPSSRIFLYKDGVMIPYSDENAMKHQLKTVGKKLIFIIQDLVPEDAGLYQVDVEEVNLFSTDFKISDVDFIVKIQEVKAMEREDALFECVLSHPLPRIKWTAKTSTLEDGDKYTITVSEDKLIHRLLVKDCMQLDKGIYAAVAGIKTCSAWLVVEADSEPGGRAGKRKARKTTQAGGAGAGVNLQQVAQEQKVKIQKEKEERIEAVVKAKEEVVSQAQEHKEPPSTQNGAGEKTVDSSLGKDNREGLNKSKTGGSEKCKQVKEQKVVKAVGDGDGLKGSGDVIKGSGDVIKASGAGIKGPGIAIKEEVMEEPKIYESQNNKRTKTGPVVLDKDTGTSENDGFVPNAQAGDGDGSGRKRRADSLAPATVIGEITDPNNEQHGGPGITEEHGRQGQHSRSDMQDRSDMHGQQGHSDMQGQQGRSDMQGQQGHSDMQGQQGRSEGQGQQGRSEGQGQQGRSDMQGQQGRSDMQGQQGRSDMQGQQGRSEGQGQQGRSEGQGQQGRSDMQGQQSHSDMQGQQGRSDMPGQQGRSEGQGQQGRSYMQGQQGRSDMQGQQGHSDMQGQQGRSEGQGQQGRSEGQGQQGRSEGQGQQGRSEGQDQQGRSDMQGQQGHSDMQGQQGRSDMQGQQGRSEGQGQQGRSEGQGQQGRSEGQGQQGRSEGQGQQGRSDMQGQQGRSDMQGQQGRSDMQGQQGRSEGQGQQGHSDMQGRSEGQGQQGRSEGQGQQGRSDMQGQQGRSEGQGQQGRSDMQGQQGRSDMQGQQGRSEGQGQQGRSDMQGQQGHSEGQGQQGRSEGQGQQGHSDMQGRSEGQGQQGRSEGQGQQGRSDMQGQQGRSEGQGQQGRSDMQGQQGRSEGQGQQGRSDMQGQQGRSDMQGQQGHSDMQGQQGRSEGQGQQVRNEGQGRSDVQGQQGQQGRSGPDPESDEESSAGSAKRSGRTRQGPLLQDTVIGEITDPNSEQRGGPGITEEHGRQGQHGQHGQRDMQGQSEGQARSGPDPESDEESSAGSAKRSGRTRQGPLLQDTVIDPGVQFVTGLFNVNALIGQPAELMCKVSSDNCDGVWFKDGKKLAAGDGSSISKDGATHKLAINSCQAEHSGIYRFEADGRKTEAVLHVQDPPRFDPDDLDKFSQPVIVRVGQNATLKLPFVGCDPMKIQWYMEGLEVLDENNVKIEKSSSHSRLLLSKCQRKQTGEIKIKLKNEHGTIEAITKLIVLDKPTPPQGPVEVVESSATCIDIKWRPPKDDGGSLVKHYNLERQQVGRNTWKKLGDIAGIPTYRDTDVDHGRKYCYRIRAVTEEGISEMMETVDITAGTLAFAGAPAPPKVASAFNDCINLTWAPPSNTGGSRILGYNLEKRKKGSNLWSPVNPTDEPIKEKKYAVKDVVAGVEYEFRCAAINVSGAGEPSNPSEFVFARDPKKSPGKVIDLKVTETTYTSLSLSWTKPTEEKGVQDEAKGYFVEVRNAECTDWTRCNSNTTPIIMNAFTVKGLKAMAMYWVRVIATNEGGEGVPQDLDNYIIAMPPPVRPRFKNNKMKSFMVVRAGNSVRITLNFEASPWPEVTWLKDDVPVTKRVTISNSDGSSQILVPSSERSDTGIYTIMVKNMVGQETFSVEVRVTDDPKSPGPVELEENVPGTVTVIWESSPDEKRDNHLHYIVSKRDSTKQSWCTVADRLFNNKFTACNIMQGREYHFRVYAKNDMGMSAPSESPTWGTDRRKERFVVSRPAYKDCDLRSAPAFLVPLKLHNAPKGYECYMSCAVKGNPKPRITWYHNGVSINTNTNYYISNICGVCSMLILRVGPKDMGEYTIIAENALGRAECSTKLIVRE